MDVYTDEDDSETPNSEPVVAIPRKRARVNKPASASPSCKRARATQKNGTPAPVKKRMRAASKSEPDPEPEDLPIAGEEGGPEPLPPLPETFILPPLPANMSNDSQQHIFEATTTNTELMKKTFGIAKEFMTDINFVINKNGITIMSYSKRHDLVYVSLNKFDRYCCEPDNLVVTISAQQVHRVVSIYSSKNVFSMYVKKCHYNEGIVSYFCLMCIDGANNKCSEVEIKVMDSDGELLVLPDITFSSVITLTSADFQETLRLINAVSSTHIRITAIGGDIIYEGTGGTIDIKIRQSESKNTLSFNKQAPPCFVTTGKFLVAAMNFILKCITLGSNIELYLDNTHPLITKFNIGTIGNLKYVVPHDRDPPRTGSNGSSYDACSR